MLIDIRSRQDLVLIEELSHLQVGLTSGCFDLFHTMHLAYLQKCRRVCDVLIVGVDGDDLVRANKGKNRPIVPEHHRVMLVNALQPVHISFIMGSLDDWILACKHFCPTILFRNSECDPTKILNPTGAQIVIVPDVIQADSTSRIIQEIVTRHNEH